MSDNNKYRKLLDSIADVIEFDGVLGVSHLYEALPRLVRERLAEKRLPEPDATNPDHVSFAAEIVGKTHPKAGYRAELNDIARRLDSELDSEQAAEREREQRIEQAARAILDFENSQFDHQAGVIPGIAPIDYARALDAAGLLRGGGRGE